jgi:hypothetical protein
MASKPLYKKPFTYGRDPSPKNWYEAAEALNTHAPKTKKSSGLMERLDKLEKLLEDKK